jgi:hypothetical protein
MTDNERDYEVIGSALTSDRFLDWITPTLLAALDVG